MLKCKKNFSKVCDCYKSRVENRAYGMEGYMAKPIKKQNKK